MSSVQSKGDTVAQSIAVIGIPSAFAGDAMIVGATDQEAGDDSCMRHCVDTSNPATQHQKNNNSPYDTFWQTKEPYSVSILSKFAANVGAEPLEIPMGIESFCFPLGGALIHKGANAPYPSYHTFVVGGSTVSF